MSFSETLLSEKINETLIFSVYGNDTWIISLEKPVPKGVGSLMQSYNANIV